MITGTYNLVADPQWRNVQLQDVFLECDTTLAPVIINLFPIADLDRFFNVKISISDVNKNASVNNITINAGSVGLVPVFDTIDEQGNTQIVLNTNGESVVFQPVSDASWIAIESLGGGGGSAPEDILYADLYDKIVNSQLVAGQKYRLTDYKSVNFLNGWDIANNNPIPLDPSFDPRQIYTGTEEVLILEAISSYELNPVCNSETYGGDILEFQGYTNKIGVDFDIFTGQTLPNATTVLDFNLKWDGTNVYFNMPTNYPALFGHYFYLYADFSGGSYIQDGCFEPLTPVIAECQYPFSNPNKNMSRLSVSADGMKVVLLDLVEADYLAYDTDSLYVETVYALGDAYGWATRRNDTQRQINVPFDFRGRIYRRYEVDLTPINPALTTGYWGQGDNYLGQGTTGNYIDVPSFGQNAADCYNIQWEGIGGADMYWYAGYCDNNVFLGTFYDNSLKYFTFNNTNKDNFSKNTTGTNFSENTLGVNFIFNTVGNGFQTNKIADNFTFNTIANGFLANTIETNFSSNAIGNSFQSNTIAAAFQLNTISNNFNSNTIGDAFTFNTIGNNFSQNTTGTNFIYNAIGSIFFLNAIGNDFIRNSIITGNDFFQNTIGNAFSSNTIATNFNNNTIANDFRRNQIEYSPTATDFTLATHVYGDYTCTIFKNSVGSLRLSYIDGTNTVIYTTPNA